MWDSIEIGDSTLPFVYEVTAEKIADFCRIARYENLAYTSQPAARETGLPGIIAPPAMALVYAPVRLADLAALRGLDCPGSDPGVGVLPRKDESPLLVKLLTNSQGVAVCPGDVITSVTSVREKYQTDNNRFITVQVTGHNQRGQLVADYTCTYLCSDISA